MGGRVNFSYKLASSAPKPACTAIARRALKQGHAWGHGHLSKPTRLHRPQLLSQDALSLAPLRLRQRRLRLQIDASGRPD